MIIDKAGINSVWTLRLKKYTKVIVSLMWNLTHVKWEGVKENFRS